MDGRADAERSVQVAQLGDLVLELLEGLAFDLRAVFVLHELEELTLPEIADQLSIPLTTARWRLRMAREHFDEALRRRRAADQRKYGAGALMLPLSADAILRLARSLPRPEASPAMEARVWARIQKEVGLSPSSHLRPERPRVLKPRAPRAPRMETLIFSGLAFAVGVVAGAIGLDLLRRPAPAPRPPHEPASILAVAPPIEDSILPSLPDPVPDTATASAIPVLPRAPADPEAEAEAERRCLQRVSALLNTPGKAREALGELSHCEQRFPQAHFPRERDELRREAQAALSRTR